MPFLKLQPESVVRINDRRTLSVETDERHLTSLSCYLTNFPFEDAYDVEWQKHVYSKLSTVFNPKFPVNAGVIYDDDTVPFNIPACNAFFKEIADRKLAFYNYTRPADFGMRANGLTFGSNSTVNLDRNDFFRYVFNAFWRQSFYRYAQFKLFKPTTELSKDNGYFVRRGLWGYFDIGAFSETYDVDGVDVTNKAEKSRQMSDWTDLFTYINWIDSNIDAFKNNYEWVGLNNTSEYRGWLSLVCNTSSSTSNRPSISAYYNDKIEGKEGKLPIFADRVEFAETVNELYENLTQINRIISRELSLLFEPSDDAEQPPPELEENGYITIKFSMENINLNGGNPDKLGTYAGYSPITQVSLSNYVLTCEYGKTYDVIDYDRFCSIGRENNQAYTMISSYNGTPTWFVGTNPYDVFEPNLVDPSHDFIPPTTGATNGRAHYDDGIKEYNLSGNGAWSPLVSLNTQTSDGIIAYSPSSPFNGRDDTNKFLGCPFSYWSEKNFYDNDFEEKLSKYEVYTVSHIKSCPSSSYDLINGINPSLLSAGSAYYPKSQWRPYFNDYMRVRLKAVADKTYYPVYDARASKEIYDFYIEKLTFKFDGATIKCLRTGVSPDTSIIRETSGEVSRDINEDPYYMKYRKYYRGDSPEEKADQYGTGTPGQKDYTGSSRPISNYDYEWRKVYDQITALSAGWHGDYFERQLGVVYVNPQGTRFPLTLIGDVRIIHIGLETDIYLKDESNYRFESFFRCTRGTRLRWAQQGSTVVVLNANNQQLVIQKGDGELRYTKSTALEAKIPLVTWDTEMTNVLSTANSINEFKNTFRASDGNGAWTNLLTYLGNKPGGLFAECTDITDQTREAVRMDRTWVFWITHSVIHSSKEHKIEYNSSDDNSERFFLVIKGFYFDVDWKTTN